MALLNYGLVIGLVITLLALLPSIVLVRQFYKYRIPESMIFAGYFFIGALTLIINVASVLTEKMILIQLTYFMFNSTFFLLFLYAVDAKWDLRSSIGKAPKSILYTGIIWYISLNVMILFWTNFPQPEFTSIMFLDIPRVNRLYSNSSGGGFIIGDFIIYGSHFDYLGMLFSLVAQILLLGHFLTLKMIQPTERALLARKLWVIAFSFGVIFSLLSLPYPNLPSSITRIFLVLGMIIVIYICVWIPEGLLLSKTQILRATKLYEIIRKSGQTELKIQPKETSEYLFNYLLDVQKILESDLKEEISNVT